MNKNFMFTYNEDEHIMEKHDIEWDKSQLFVISPIGNGLDRYRIYCPQTGDEIFIPTLRYYKSKEIYTRKEIEDYRIEILDIINMRKKNLNYFLKKIIYKIGSSIMYRKENNKNDI